MYSVLIVYSLVEEMAWHTQRGTEFYLNDILFRVYNEIVNSEVRLERLFADLALNMFCMVCVVEK